MSFAYTIRTLQCFNLIGDDWRVREDSDMRVSSRASSNVNVEWDAGNSAIRYWPSMVLNG